MVDNEHADHGSQCSSVPMFFLVVCNVLLYRLSDAQDDFACPLSTLTMMVHNKLLLVSVPAFVKAITRKKVEPKRSLRWGKMAPLCQNSASWQRGAKTVPPDKEEPFSKMDPLRSRFSEKGWKRCLFFQSALFCYLSGTVMAPLFRKEALFSTLSLGERLHLKRGAKIVPQRGLSCGPENGAPEELWCTTSTVQNYVVHHQLALCTNDLCCAPRWCIRCFFMNVTRHHPDGAQCDVVMLK